MKSISFLVLFLIFLLTKTAAQDISGNIEGRVVDSTGNTLAGVNISLQSENLQGTKGTSSNEKGYFNILSLPVGIYDVKISTVGYRILTLENVQVSLGKTTYLGEIILEQQTIDLPEVTIFDEKLSIDPRSTINGGTIQSKEFEKLPVDRDYKQIATLFPQANTSYYGDAVNIGGGTGRETKFFIDGVDVTGLNIGLERTAMYLPYNFVKEIEVTTGGYEAEYRGSLGGLVSVITRSGSNEVHGSLFGFYTSDWLSAEPQRGLIDPTQGAYSNYDIGGSIGFPLVNDELWMFASYNPIFFRREVELPGLGVEVDKTIMHSFATKLTWRASRQLNLSLTCTGDPLWRDAIGDAVLIPADSLTNPDPYQMNVQDGGINLSLSGLYTINEKILMDATIYRTTINEVHEPSTELGKSEIVFTDRETGVVSGGSYGPYSFYRFSTGARLNSSFIINDHILKAGIEYRDYGVEEDIQRQWLIRNNDSSYSLSSNVVMGTVHNLIPSVYVQDSWQVTRSICINAGLRWDGQFFVATNGEVAQKITDQFQPRIGIVFLPDKDQKFFGSFGRFAQEVHAEAIIQYHSDQGIYSAFEYMDDPRYGSPQPDTIWYQPFMIEPEIPGLRGQYYDEFTLGYERRIGDNILINLQGIYRALGEAIEDGYVSSDGRFRIGNPARGILSDFPEAQRDYTALVISVQQRSSGPFNFLASYVLSRNYGNYPGLFDAYLQSYGPNVNLAFDDIGALEKATGLLPNDRTHVFKISGSYRFGFGLLAGSSFIWQSGTPLSEWGGLSSQYEWFFKPRGSLGRTASVWDLNVRFAYDFSISSSWQSRLILDILHIASQREPVNIVQDRYLTVDENGNPSDLNPDYGKTLSYQPPMAIRLGLEVSF